MIFNKKIIGKKATPAQDKGGTKRDFMVQSNWE